MEELSTAVFEEGRPVAELRKQFDPVFFPKPKGAKKLEAIKRADAAARKLVEALPEGVRDQYLGQVPLGRLGTATEVARLVGFLAGPDAAYITGQTIHVNGGMHMV